jgi:hypothetical protein
VGEVRGKFRVTEVTRNHWQKSAAQIKLEAVYDPSLPEDVRYAEATPTGTIVMYVNNPSAVEALELGKGFYVDFVPVAEDSLGNTITDEAKSA